MKNNKLNKIIFTMIGLTAFSGVLFAYDNFYLNRQEENEIIYVAKQDIPAKTVLNQDMFTPISISSDSVLSVYVTDPNEIVGKQLKGGILKDEPLSKNRLTTLKDLQHNLEIKIEADASSISVNNNEYINLYVILYVNGDLQIRKVFDNKQIQKETVSTNDGNITYLTMKVTEEEATKYLDAKERGKILIVKNNNLDGNVEATDYDPNSEEAKNSTIPSEEKDNQTHSLSVITKKFEEGDTLDNLAIKYKTSVDEIKKLNNKEEFKVGDEIILPAN